jgi:GT2 family glycosyltransferase
MAAATRCSIVIPVHADARLTQRCLEAALSLDAEGVKQEFVVVAADSKRRATPAALHGFGGRIRIVRSEESADFGRACNAGARASTGEQLVFLDSETIPQPGWLEALVDYADRHTKAAVLGSKLLGPDGLVRHAGMVVGHDRDLRNLYAGFRADHPAVNTSRCLQAVSCIGALVRREAFERAGGFELPFASPYAEADLCLRLGVLGYEVHYCHRSTVVDFRRNVAGRLGDSDGRRLYRERWAELVRPDELDYWLEDGLLQLEYGDSYPVEAHFSPLVVSVSGTAGDGQALELSRLSQNQTALLQSLRDEVLAGLQEIRASLDELRDASPEGLPPGRVGEKAAYRRLVGRIRTRVREELPPDVTVAVVSRGDEALVQLAARRAWHFPRAADGRWAGYHPSCSLSAIAHLEALRARGAEYLLVPSASAWWLDHYVDFTRHLEHRYRVVIRESDLCVVYALEAPMRGDGERAELDAALADCETRLGRPPAILDWNSGLDLDRALPEHRVFSPPDPGPALPYVDRSIDVVAVGSLDDVVLAEAERVCAQAVIVAVPEAGGRQTLEVRWSADEGAKRLPSSSVVIPVYDALMYTEMCLRTLRETLPRDFDVEVILVDDGSTTETGARLRELADTDPRIRVVRNERNSGFVHSCNRGAEAAGGDVIVFLNNDTVLLPGWFPPLVRLLDQQPEAGVVGGKLLFEDGTLQEAGSVIFRDGSAANFGRGDANPADPLYNYVREVDYCSGALFATRRELFAEVGGFDTRYSPGYCEDSDYCFAVRELGYRVYYQPASSIVHFEGGTAGTDLGSGAKRFQVTNQAKFVEKWRHVLQRQPRRPDRPDPGGDRRLALRTGGADS